MLLVFCFLFVLTFFIYIMAFIIYNFTAGLLIIFSALPNKCGFKSLVVQKTLSKNTLTNFQEKSRLMFGRMDLLFRMNLSLTLVNPSPAKSRKQLGHNVVKGNVQKLVKATISALKSWSVNYQIPDFITTMNTGIKFDWALTVGKRLL